MEKGYYWKITILSLVMFLVFVGAAAIGAAAHGESINGHYPRAGRIVKMDEEEDVFLVQDGAGLTWWVENIEDFELGDVVAMLMDDSGTEDTILDDKVLLCYYSRIDPPEGGV